MHRQLKPVQKLYDLQCFKGSNDLDHDFSDSSDVILTSNIHQTFFNQLRTMKSPQFLYNIQHNRSTLCRNMAFSLFWWWPS